VVSGLSCGDRGETPHVEESPQPPVAGRVVRGIDRLVVLAEELGDVKLKELRARDIQETLDALAAPSTRGLQIVRNCLERAIWHAEVRDLVGRNVAASIAVLSVTMWS
jgi:hypothetical protein